MKKKILAIALCAAMVLSVSACGNRGNDTAEDEEATIYDDFTGLRQMEFNGEDGLWYLREGIVQDDLNGFGPVDNETETLFYYVRNGQGDLDYTGVVYAELNDDMEYWFVEEGVLDTEYAGFIKADINDIQADWYVENGMVALNKTGLVSGELDGIDSEWYVKDGVAMTDYEGFIYEDAQFKYVKDGQFDKMTGFVEGTINGTEGYYIVDEGIVNLDYTGFCKAENIRFDIADGWVYVVDGMFAEDMTGFVEGTINEEEGNWYVVDGVVQLDFTGIIEDGEETVYVENGKMSDYTGVVDDIDEEDIETTWYVEDGIIQDTYTGEVEVNGEQYVVENGKAEPVKQETTETVTIKEQARETDVPTETNPVNYIVSGMNFYNWSGGEYMGRLRIPSVGIDVGIYYLTNNDTYDQQIVDREDSACVTVGNGHTTADIGDHANQEFATLGSVATGDYMYIDTSLGTYRYKCVSTGYGQVIQPWIYDSNGTNICTLGDPYVCCYTCTSWPSIMYTLWIPA